MVFSEPWVGCVEEVYLGQKLEPYKRMWLLVLELDVKLSTSRVCTVNMKHEDRLL